MSINDKKQLLRVLRDAVRASRIPSRELERALGIGNGRLEQLLDGTLELRVRHLLAFARVLRVPVADFLELGCPESARTAEFRLADWIGNAPRNSSKTPTDTPLPTTVEELDRLIRSAVQKELEARKSS